MQLVRQIQASLKGECVCRPKPDFSGGKGLFLGYIPFLLVSLFGKDKPGWQLVDSGEATLIIQKAVEGRVTFPKTFPSSLTKGRGIKGEGLEDKLW